MQQLECNGIGWQHKQFARVFVHGDCGFDSATTASSVSTFAGDANAAGSTCFQCICCFWFFLRFAQSSNQHMQRQLATVLQLRMFRVRS
jgi:hypothetical protein